jgi:adenosylmethionine-8-amino-7-oxononanoate aminotransferase
MDRNVVTRVWDVLHLAPPLIVTKDEVDNVVGAIDESLTIAENEYASEIQA